MFASPKIHFYFIFWFPIQLFVVWGCSFTWEFIYTTKIQLHGILIIATSHEFWAFKGFSKGFELNPRISGVSLDIPRNRWNIIPFWPDRCIGTPMIWSPKVKGSHQQVIYLLQGEDALLRSISVRSFVELVISGMVKRQGCDGSGTGDVTSTFTVGLFSIWCFPWLFQLWILWEWIASEIFHHRPSMWRKSDPKTKAIVKHIWPQLRGLSRRDVALVIHNPSCLSAGCNFVWIWYVDW